MVQAAAAGGYRRTVSESRHRNVPARSRCAAVKGAPDAARATACRQAAGNSTRKNPRPPHALAVRSGSPAASRSADLPEQRDPPGRRRSRHRPARCSGRPSSRSVWAPMRVAAIGIPAVDGSAERIAEGLRPGRRKPDHVRRDLIDQPRQVARPSYRPVTCIRCRARSENGPSVWPIRWISIAFGSAISATEATVRAALVVDQRTQHGDPHPAFARRQADRNCHGPAATASCGASTAFSASPYRCNRVTTSLARTEHPVGLAELPGAFRPPRDDFTRATRTAMRDAGVAARHIRFATVKAVPPGQQIDLRTDVRNNRAPSRRTAHAKPMRPAPGYPCPCQEDDECGCATLSIERSRRTKSSSRSAGSASDGCPGSVGTESAAPRSVACSSRNRARSPKRSTSMSICRRTPPPSPCDDHQDHRQSRLPKQRRGQREAKRGDIAPSPT